MIQLISILTIVTAVAILGWTVAHFEYDGTSRLPADSTVAAPDTLTTEENSDEKSSDKKE